MNAYIWSFDYFCAAFSAPLLGSIPVTHRGKSNQVVMCTGYGRNGTSPDLIQYHKEQTIVFLMAVGRLRELCERLINMAGYPSKTPVGIIQNAGCPNQRTVVGNMENIADLSFLGPQHWQYLHHQACCDGKVPFHLNRRL